MQLSVDSEQSVAHSLPRTFTVRKAGYLPYTIMQGNSAKDVHLFAEPTGASPSRAITNARPAAKPKSLPRCVAAPSAQTAKSPTRRHFSCSVEQMCLCKNPTSLGQGAVRQLATNRAAARALLLLAASHVRADDFADQAELEFSLGAEAYQRADYRSALEHFLTSNRLVPNKNVLFNIARSYEQLKSYPEAFRYYSLALDGESNPRHARKRLDTALWSDQSNS